MHETYERDSLLGIVPMPGGVPVATVAMGSGGNAGLLAVQILAVGDAWLLRRVQAFKQGLARASREKHRALQNPLIRGTGGARIPPPGCG